jgi:hypothetical protein
LIGLSRQHWIKVVAEKSLGVKAVELAGLDLLDQTLPNLKMDLNTIGIAASCILKEIPLDCAGSGQYAYVTGLGGLGRRLDGRFYAHKGEVKPGPQ